MRKIVREKAEITRMIAFSELILYDKIFLINSKSFL